MVWVLSGKSFIFMVNLGSGGWVFVWKHKYSNRGWTLAVTNHTTRSNINTLMFLCGKTPTGKHPRPQPTQPLGVFY